MIKSIDRAVILGGIRYRVYVLDDQIVFRHRGIKNYEIAFDRPLDKTTKLPSAWYLSSYESSENDKIPLIHFVDAFKYLGEEFGECFKPYLNELKEINK